eukprot:15482421-Alexandrium_andersonii.AAC.1
MPGSGDSPESRALPPRPQVPPSMSPRAGAQQREATGPAGAKSWRPPCTRPAEHAARGGGPGARRPDSLPVERGPAG